MATEESGNTSGSDGDHGYTSDGGGGAVRGEGGGESVSGVTEVGSNGNAAAAKARWGGGEDWLSRLTREGEGEAEDSAGDEEEEKASAGECVVAYSPVWLVAARLGWLLLGFLAGAAVAATALFLKHDGCPGTCTVPT